MNVHLISKDAALVELVQDECRYGLHDLSVHDRWPTGDPAARHLTVVDLDLWPRPSDLNPEAIQECGHVVLVSSAAGAAALDNAILSAASDLMIKPLRRQELRYRLCQWDLLLHQQEDIELLGARVDTLAADSDRHASELQDVELSHQLVGRHRSRLDQVVAKMQMVTRLSRLINCLDLQTIVEACIERVPLLVDARFASLYFHDPRSGHLVLERHNHPRKIADRIDLADVVNSPMSLAIRRKKLILIEDFAAFENREQVTLDRNFKEHYKTGSCIISPLMSGHRIIGVLNLADKVTGEPFDTEIDLPPIEQLCELIGASIYNIELFREVERQAKTDGLTGLANRRTFIETLSAEVERAKRYGSKVSMLMIDLDRLKDINDSLGHAAGDAALNRAAEIIRSSVRNSDLPARYGGDEFSVVLVETGLRQAQTLATRLLKAIQKDDVEFEGKRIQMTLSIGVGQFDNDATPEHLIKRVDAALYEAKQQGRNRVAVAEQNARE
jgi:diguanylate cyclase (GGDEF)-like protein